MKKIITLINALDPKALGKALMILAVVGLAFDGFSQNRQRQNFGEPMPIPETKTGILETPKFMAGNKSVATPQYGDLVGSTYYDYQTNGCMQERIYVDAAGNVSMVWTQGLDTAGGGAFPDRGVGYNYYNATSMAFEPGDSAGQPNGLAPSRVGWPTLAPKEGASIVAAHALVILKNSASGASDWSARTPSEITSGILFPHFSYSDNGTLHMIHSNTGRTGFAYARSTNDGDTFDIVDVNVAGLFGLDQLVTYNDLRDDVADIVCKGDTVVIGAGGFGSDYYIFKSYDNGVTWTDTIKVHGIDTVGTAGNPSAGFQVLGPDNTAKINIDNNGVVHMVAGLNANLINADLTQAGSYYPEIRGIFYWNETMPRNVNVNDSIQYDQYILVDSIWDSFQPTGAYLSGAGATDFIGLLVSGLFSHPNILVDDNNDAYIVFSAPPAGAADASVTLDGYQRRDLYVMRYDGTSWTTPNNIAGIAGAGDGLTEGTSFYEELYPVTPRRVINGNIHVLYQVGQTPGSAIIDAKFGFEEEKTFAHYAFSTALVGNQDLIDNANTASFNVYPNPAADVLNIDMVNRVSNADIKITNAIGQVVRTINLNDIAERNVTLDVSDLEYGVYFVTVNDGTAQSTKRVVIE